MSRETSCSCGGKAVEQHVEEDVIWGTDGITKYGRHVFPAVPQTFWKCTVCGEEFFDYDQAMAKDRVLNERIKEKLGIDWLEEKHLYPRRPRRKRSDRRGR